jgi:penicillin amidase
MDWDSGSDGYRAKRITQMIKEAPYGSLTASDMQQIQTDYLSLAQRDLAIALYNLSDNLFRVGGGGKVVKNLLYNFDGHLSVGSQVATLWADVLSELGKLANKEVGENWQNMVFLLNALSSDISGTSDPACISSSFSSCAAFAANALDIVADMRGITSGSENLNMIPAWGIDIHKLKIEHAVLSSSPLACVADRIESHGGDGFTINVGSYSDDGYDQTHGPSYRQIIDLATPDLSLFVHPMGLDGAPFSYDNDDDRISAFNPSGSYDDLLPLWLEGNYVSMSMNGKENSNRLTMRFSPE